MTKNALKEAELVKQDAPLEHQAIAKDHYIGTLKAPGGVIPFELRQPTLDDMPALESLLSNRGLDLASMSSLPKTEMIYMLFVLLCVRFGDSNGCSRESLGKLPLAAFQEVAKAVENFREQFGI